jgi:hypothetical protein
MLIIDMEIKNTICPICESNSFKVGVGFSSGSDEGGAYIIPALNYLKENTDEFFKKNKVYSCNTCYTSWIEPWFTSQQSKVIFDSIKSNHQAGWDQFEYALKNKNPNYYMSWIKQIIEILKRKNLSFCNYAEVGCPFSGIALINNIPSHKSDSINSLFRSKENGSLWLQFDHFLNKISFLAFKTLSKHRAKKIEFQNISIKKSTFITVNSNKGWGVSCVRMDRTCAGAALDSRLFDEVLNINDIPINTDYTYDIVGFFNYFDHLDNPLFYLDKIQKLSKNVIVCTHYLKSIGWQHKYGFDIKFIEFLQKRYASKNIYHLSTLYNEKNEPIEFCFIIEG